MISARWSQTMHINDDREAMGHGQPIVQSLIRLIDDCMLDDELVSYCLLGNSD